MTTYFAVGPVVLAGEMMLARVFAAPPAILLASRMSLLAFVVLSLTACKEDPLKDWSNSKLNSKAAECAGIKKHNPRTGVICSQVLESCSFRGISCR